MTAVQLVTYAVQLSMALGVFCIALEATPRVVRSLLEHPGLVARALVAMFVIMPLFALALVGLFELRRDLEIALVCLALAPVPPILPKKQIKAGGTSTDVLALLGVTALASIVVVPLAVNLLGWGLGRTLEVPHGALLRIVTTSLLLPMVAGLLVTRWAPDFAHRIAGKLGVAASVLLVVAILPVLYGSWRVIVSEIGNFTLGAIAAFVVAGLATGHLLGGPDEDDRTVVALATATRHPGVAIAIAHAVAPGQKTVPAAVILYLLAGTIFSLPYVKWRMKRAAAGVPKPAA